MSPNFPLSRRGLLISLAAGATSLAPAQRARANPLFTDFPFQLGVAAGDPVADGFVIWTRLAPRPLESGGGVPPVPVPVIWEVAADPGFTQVVRRGEALARPELGHSVHVEVTGLEPERDYTYRFLAGGEASPPGRAKTTPARSASPSRARFGVVGCQSYEQGLYTAHRKIAEESLDFIYCYGDYIYEGRGAAAPPRPGSPRAHLGGEIYSLDDYRRRYAQYKMDPDLQASHASTAWFCTWDDHEIDNNWAGDKDQDGTPPEIFNLRRQIAMQAYYEHMPLRASSFPRGVQMQVYRNAAWGGLLDLNFLDTRSHRSDQPCGDKWATTCDAVRDPAAQVLGEAQEAWLFRNLARSQARWKVLAQQVMMMDLERREGPDPGYNLDTWAGYAVPRARLLAHLRDRRIGNTVILTGDEHQHYAGEVFRDGRNPTGAPLAVEFVSTSISSGGDGVDQRPDGRRYLAENPFLKFNNAQRGYLVCDVSPQTWRSEFKVLDQVSRPGGVLSTRAAFVVENGAGRLTAA